MGDGETDEFVGKLKRISLILSGNPRYRGIQTLMSRRAEPGGGIRERRLAGLLLREMLGESSSSTLVVNAIDIAWLWRKKMFLRLGQLVGGFGLSRRGLGI